MIQQNEDEQHSETSALTVDIDWRRFAHHLENLDMSETQKRELIVAYAGILVGFVELGFGVTAGYRSCEKEEKSNEFASNTSGKMLQSKQISRIAKQQKTAPAEMAEGSDS